MITSSIYCRVRVHVCESDGQHGSFTVYPRAESWQKASEKQLVWGSCRHTVHEHYIPLDILSDVAVISKYRLSRNIIWEAQLQRPARCTYSTVCPYTSSAGAGCAVVLCHRQLPGGCWWWAVLWQQLHPCCCSICKRSTSPALWRTSGRQAFFAIGQLPRVIGAIVIGTLIPIVSPTVNKPQYIFEKRAK